MQDIRKYITNEGHRRLSEELSNLWYKKRPEIVKAIATAAAEGDRSENAEYIYRKKELRETDRKIRQLERSLKDVNIVMDKPQNQQKVFFGAWVDLLDEDDHPITYRIVGGMEARLEEKEISVLSPVAQALLGKELEDEVSVTLPSGGQVTFFIDNIRY